MRFEDLKKSFVGGIISYQDLLSTEEWAEKRNQILERDNFACTKCGNEWNPYLIELGGDGSIEDLSKYRVKNSWLEESEYETWKNLMKDRPKTSLHIHHKHYYLNRLPWDYSENELVTLCETCHKKEHEENHIPVYSENDIEIYDLIFCTRCSGSGYLPQYYYVQNGICFLCNGQRFTQNILGYNIKK